MLPTRQWENCGNSEPSTSTMGDNYRKQSISEDKNRGLGVAPKEGVDTGPHDGGDIFNHGREGDRYRDGRMVGRESVGTERPAAAARGLGSIWPRLQTRRPSTGQQTPNAAATRR